MQGQFLTEQELFIQKHADAVLKDEWCVEKAIRDRTIVCALATLYTERGDLVVPMKVMNGIIPRDQCSVDVDGKPVKDIAVMTRVGKPVCFIVTDVRYDPVACENVAILSRRAAQEVAKDKYLDRLVPGDVIPCTITRAEKFGAFCDVGCGNLALIPVGKGSVSRVDHTEHRFSVGDNIFGAVFSKEGDRLVLSCKELLGTWQDNIDMLGITNGCVTQGVIRSIEEYGIFVELSANLCGLTDFYPEYKVGQRVSVLVRSIAPETSKIKLSIVDTISDNAQIKPHFFIRDGHIDTWTYHSAKNSHATTFGV